MSRQRIFVYGTLKSGRENAHYLKGQTFIGEAATLPIYRLWECGGYPGMRQVEQDGLSIQGEIWEVDEQCRVGLDQLEGLDEGLYVVEPVQLLPPYADGTVLTYIYARSVAGFPDAGNNW